MGTWREREPPRRTGAVGTALTGTVFGIGVVVFTSIVFLSCIGKEEKIMLELFPNEYPA